MVNKREMIERLKKVYYSSDIKNMSEEELEMDMNNKKIISVILFAASFLLTILNIINHYLPMTISTAILAVLFVACYKLADNVKNHNLITFLMAISLVFFFSYYTIFGKNEGFAILWTMLIPSLGMLIVGIRPGVMLCIYFETLFVILFDTPIRIRMAAFYTNTFLVRYPILFLVNCIASLYLVSSKTYYQKMAEEMAFTDVLTGLFNRRYCEDTLRKQKSLNNFDKLAVFMIDVNRLKFTNDNFGHEAGDKLLVSVSEFLKEVFNEDDVVGRIGGDEFVAISFINRDKIKEYQDKLAEYKFILDGKLVPEPSLSVGIVYAGDYANATIDEIEKLADQAMYAAKSEYYKKTGVDRRK